MGLSVSNYFVLMLCDNVESAPPLIPATCWVHCKQDIFQLFPAIIYLFISDLTISGYLMKLFSDGVIGQEGKQAEKHTGTLKITLLVMLKIGEILWGLLLFF